MQVILLSPSKETRQVQVWKLQICNDCDDWIRYFKFRNERTPLALLKYILLLLYIAGRLNEKGRQTVTQYRCNT